jgi:hypothetical protein
MSESHPRTVTVRDGLEFVTLNVARPQVVPVLHSAGTGGGFFEFHGTEQELVAAGVATAAMFENFGESKQRTRTGEFGDTWKLTRRRGVWILELMMDNGCMDDIPSDRNPEGTKWWAKHGGKAEAATAAILERFARPAPGVRT